MIIKVVALVPVPNELVTVIYPEAKPEGVTAVIVVSFTTVNEAALTLLNCT